MNTQSDAVRETAAGMPAVATANATTTRPLYWSVRRELWENRSLIIAPVTVAVVILVGFLIAALRALSHLRQALVDPEHQRMAVQMPYDVAAALILVTAVITAAFYCLDALYGERRERSILFWKSLPVSDTTTVLSKISIPLVVLPLITFAIIVATHVVILVMGIVILPGGGFSAATMWAQLPLFRMWIALLYALAVMALWHAPLYAWLLLVSGWVRKAAFLWAMLPPFAIAVLEKISFNTLYFRDFLKYRAFGWFLLAFAAQPDNTPPPADPLSTLTPGRFLSTPGVWLGLVVAAIFLALAVRQRRYRGPL